MKKGILVICLCLSIFMLGGCGNGAKTMTCKRTATQNGLKMDMAYTVNYKGSTVEEVHTVEKIISTSASTLKEYKELVEKTYEPYKNISEYSYSVTIDGDTLTSKTDINYAKIDTDKLIEIDSANGNLIKDGKINIKDLQSAYESLGTTCESK